ncbi:MAG: fibronectin type III domain-containing protein [Acidobacteriaceae bacterium]
MLVHAQELTAQRAARREASRARSLALPLQQARGWGAKTLLGFLPVLLLSGCGTTTAAAPNLATAAASKYSAQLTWNPSGGSDPAASYNVYRELAGGSAGFQQINTSPVLQATYTDRTVQLGVSYTYEIRAVDAEGNESEPSNITTVVIPSN